MNILYFFGLFVFSMLLLFSSKRGALFYHEISNPVSSHLKVSIGAILSFYICFFLVLLCSTRPFVGTYDTAVYVEWLDEICELKFFEINGRYRIGFELLSKAILLLCRQQYRLYFAIIVVFNYFVILKAFSRLKLNSSLCSVLYLGFFGLYYNFIVIRAGIAISFTLLAFSFLKESKVKAFFIILIAVSFHETALVVLVAFFLRKLLLPIRKGQLLILIGISILLYITKFSDMLFFSAFNRLQPKLPARWFHTYSLYLISENAVNEMSVSYLMYFCLSFLLVYLYSDNYALFDDYLVINVLGQFGFSLFSSNTIVGRLWDYLVPTTFIILLPVFFAGKRNGRFLLFLVFLLGITLQTRIIITRLPFYI